MLLSDNASELKQREENKERKNIEESNHEKERKHFKNREVNKESENCGDKVLEQKIRKSKESIENSEDEVGTFIEKEFEKYVENDKEAEECIIDSGSNITSTSLTNTTETINENKSETNIMMGDGVKTMLTTRGKLIIDGYELDCIDLNINSPRLLSVSQLTKVGYTAIFTGNKLLLIKPMIGYDNSKIRDAIKKFSQDWGNITLEITQEDCLYKVNVKD